MAFTQGKIDDVVSMLCSAFVGEKGKQSRYLEMKT